MELQLVQRPPSEAESRLAARQRVEALSEVVEMRAMASPADGGDGRAMVELKAVDSRLPAAGRGAGPETEGAPRHCRRCWRKQGGDWGALAEAGLLAKLGLREGDTAASRRGAFAIRACDRPRAGQGGECRQLRPAY